MRKIYSFLLFVALAMVPIVAQSQGIAVAPPYNTGFETGNDVSWNFANSTNGWYIGNATNNGGSRSLYISNDGGVSNEYTISGATSSSYAYKPFILAATEYTFEFDWKAYGEGGFDYLRVFIAPTSATFTAGDNNGIGTSGAPSGWTALDGGGKLSQSTSWQHVQSSFTPSTAGTYYLVFYWRNDGNMGTQSPAAIDNVSVIAGGGGGQTTCGQPVAIPYSEGFEGGEMPVCWTKEGAGSWMVGTGDYYSSTGTHAGNYNALITHSETNYVTKLISPTFNLSTTTAPQLTFWYINRAWVGDTDELRVYYRTSSTGTWQQVFATTEEHDTWTEATVSLPNTAIQIAFEMTDNYGYGVAIDDIYIGGGTPTTCSAVSLPYSYGFEDASELDCWTVINNSLASNAPGISPAAAHTGSYGFHFNSENQTMDDYDQYLISPQLNANVEMIVKFSHYGSSGAYSTFEVGYSTTTSNVNDFTWNAEVTQYGSMWTDYSTVFPASTKYVAIHYTGVYSIFEPTYLDVDDILITAAGGSDTSSVCVQNIPYAEGFEGVTGELINQPGNMPGCWYVYTTGTAATPHVATGNWSYCKTGVNSLALNADIGTDWGTEYAVIPRMSVPLNQLRLSFWMCTESSTDGVLTVGYVTSDDHTTFTPIQTYSASTATVYSGNDGLQPAGTGLDVTLDLSSVPASATRLAFKWETSTDWYGCCIDDINIAVSQINCTQTVPYYEGFEGYDAVEYFGSINLNIFPQPLPDCWDGTITSDVCIDPECSGQTYLYRPHVLTNTGAVPVCWSGGTQGLEMVAAAHSSTYALLPPMNAPLNQLQLMFWMGTNYYATGASSLTVGYVTSDDATTFVPLQSYPATEATIAGLLYTSGYNPQGKNIMISLSNVPASATRLAFKWENNADVPQVKELYPLCFIDDISITPLNSTNILYMTACEPYYWNQTGMTYNTSGVYKAGDILYLTINHAVGKDTTVCIPNGTFTWHGVEYAASGDYTYIGYDDVTGCDLTDTLHLTIGNCCPPKTLPYYTSFEEVSGVTYSGSTNPSYPMPMPECWLVATTAPASAMVSVPHVMVANTGGAVLWKSGVNSLAMCQNGDNYAYALLPEIIVPLNNLRLKFWMGTLSPYGGTLTVGYVTNDDYSTFTALHDYPSTTGTLANIVSLAEPCVGGSDVVLDLTNVPYEATRLAFRWNSSFSCFIDDISVDFPNIYDCLPAQDIQATDVQTYQVILRWYDPNGGASYTVSHEGNVDATGLTADADGYVTCTINNLSQATSYTFKVQATCSTGYLSNFASIVVTTSQCEVLTNLQTVAHSTSVQLSWEDPNGGTSYSVMQFTDDPNNYIVELASGILAGADGHATYTIPNLSPGTDYFFAVAGSCFNNWIDTFAVFVTTDNICAVAIPYTENFEADGHFDCWTVYATAPSTGRYEDATEALNGTGCFRFIYSTNPPQYLISPELTGTGDGVRLGFSYRVGNSGFSESFMVGYSTTTNETSAFVWSTEMNNLSNETYERYVKDMVANGIKYVAVKYTADDQLRLCIDSLVIRRLPDCLTVSDLTASDVTSNSVTLSWTDALNSGASYTIYNVADNSVVATGITATNHTITGLTEHTTYTFAVVANCSAGESSDPVEISVTTPIPCGVFALPYTENFEADGYYDCWTVYSTKPYTGRHENDYFSLNGTGYFVFEYSTNPPQYLISPELTGTGNSLQLSFSYKTSGANSPESFMVGYSTTTNDTSAFVWSTEMTNLTNTSYKRYVEYLLANGIKYVAVKYTAYNQYVLFIDSLVIREISCSPVSNLIASDVTTNSVTLSWTDEMNSGATYTIYNAADNSIVATDITTTNYTITGLTINTAYTFAVVTNCSAGESSDPMSVSVTTSCGVFALPYTENFESDGYYGCWTVYATSPYTDRFYGANFALNGTSCFSFAYSTNPPQYLISPELAGTGIGLQFSFSYRVHQASLPESFMVGYSTTTNDTNAFVWSTEMTNLTNQTYERYFEFMVANGIKYVAVKYTAYDKNSLFIDSLVIREITGCVPVSNLTVSDVTSNSVTLSWTDALNSGATYTIYNSADNSILATDISATNHTVTGLTANTAYTFVVVANCSASESSDPVSVSVTTPCGVFVIPYTENFESDGYYDCWTVYATDPSTGLYDNLALNGTSCFRFHFSTDPQYLISPELTGTGNSLQLVFSYRVANSGFPESFMVGYSTTTNDTSAFVWSTEMTNLTNDTYERYVEDMLANGIKYVAVKYTAYDKYNLFIDSLVIREIPSCLPVSNLTVGDVTSNSVSLSWTDALNNGATYTIYNAADNSIVAANITTTNYTVMGLTGHTTYTFAVVANCSAGESSDPVSVGVTTLCGFALPYTENFEADGHYDCWTVYASTQYTRRLDDATVALNGTGCFRFRHSTNPPQYLISPELMGTGNGLQLGFSYRVYGPNYPESFMVGYSTTTNDTSAFVWSTEMTNLTNTNYERYVESMAANGIKYVAVKYTAYDQIYLYIDSLVIREIPSCIQVSNITVSDVTPNSVTLSWTDAQNSGATYTIYNAADNSIVATGITATNYTVTGLTAETTYTFVVVANCSASESSDPTSVIVTTSCEAFSIPYTENFEVDGRYDCWTVYATTSGTGRYEDVSFSMNGTGCFRFLYSRNLQYLISPELTGTGNSLQLGFSYRVGGASWPESFMVGYSTTTNDTSAFVWSAEMTNLINTSYERYEEFMLANGIKYVAVKYTSYNQASLFIDSLVIREIQTCLPVTNLAVDSVSATTVSLSWTGTAASYTVMNGNAEVATGVTETHYTVPGLTPATNYTFSVIANCSATESLAPVSINATTDSAHCDILLNLGVQDVWSDQADIHWTDPTNGSIVYTLLQLTSDPTHPYQVIVTGLHADATGMVSYTIPNLVPGQSYTFAVAAACTRNMVDTIEIVITTESTPVHNESACYVPYEWHGVEYFVPGEYYSRNDTLFLEVLYGDTTAIACDSFDWYEYLGITASGDYIHVFTSATACDSVVTLHLTVNHGTHNVYDTTVCESYEWHGVTYTNSDTYTYEYTNATGCVSVDTLHLTIINCCSPVENLVVDGVSDTTVSLSWMGTAAYYTVMNGTAQVATNITDTHYTVTGLTASTNYIFSVIANCSATSSSAPVSISATTSEAEVTVNLTVVPNNPAMSLHVLGSGSYHVGDTAILAAVANNGFYFVNWEANGTVMSADNPYYLLVTLNLPDTIFAIFDTTSCEPVINLHYSDTTSTTVHLVWEDPNNTNATYSVGYYDGDEINIVATGLTATDYNVIGLTPGTTYYFVVRTDCGDSVMVYSMPLIVTMPSPNAIASFGESADMKIYPNPTTDKVNVQLIIYNNQLYNIDIQLYDMYGKLLDVVKTQQETTEIDLSQYARGVYFIKAVDGQQLLGVRKIVKQ